MTKLYLIIIIKNMQNRNSNSIENVVEFHNLKDKNAKKLYICEIAGSWTKFRSLFLFWTKLHKLIASKYYKHFAWTFSYSCNQFENVKVDFDYLRGAFNLSYKNAMKCCLD